jgi:arginyl-tRNA synthetase
MLDLKGNTAVYMLYAHARIAGIIRKSGRDVSQLALTGHISLDHPYEVSTLILAQRMTNVPLHKPARSF